MQRAQLRFRKPKFALRRNKNKHVDLHSSAQDANLCICGAPTFLTTLHSLTGPVGQSFASHLGGQCPGDAPTLLELGSPLSEPMPAITLPDSRVIFFYWKIFKRALLFLRYRITLCPNVETLSLYIVITLYCYRFGHMGTY